jgi:ABC-type polysaccharide/polyol phosphate export permease
MSPSLILQPKFAFLTQHMCFPFRGCTPDFFFFASATKQCCGIYSNRRNCSASITISMSSASSASTRHMLCGCHNLFLSFFVCVESNWPQKNTLYMLKFLSRMMFTVICDFGPTVSIQVTRWVCSLCFDILSSIDGECANSR